MNGSIKLLSNVTPIAPQSPQLQVDRTEQTKVNFSDILKGAINKVNEAQNESDYKTELLVRGEITDLHDVMISLQKASITMETAVQVQQKVIDAYNEVMRMQI